jgi:threonine synthase
MKLWAETRSALEKCIDEGCSPESSIVSRYRQAVRFDDQPGRDLAFKRHLLETSIREGARIVPLMTYKGVTIHLLDETSGMTTGSLKAIDGCLTTALCRMEGVGRIVFESGGNTGSALTQYGQNAGLETFFFCPIDNLDLLDSRLFDTRKSHLIGVEERGRVKELAALFATAAGIKHVPDRSWRYAASMFRGLFILEHMLTVGAYDWISQTVSAAFGPIGIYSVLNTFREDVRGVPRFLGIQQEANCPLFEAWKPNACPKEGKLLTRIMYDDSPQTYRTYEDFYQLLMQTHGDLLTVNEEEFDSYIYQPAEYGSILELFLSQGVAISLISGRILEKTGMIALAGTLKAIEAGTIEAGSRVLCCLTSGVSDADRSVQPELIVRDARDVLDYVDTISGGE